MRVCGLPRGTTKRQGWAEEEPWRPRWLSKQYSTVLNSRYKVLSAKIWASSMETVTECWQRVKTRSTGEMQYFKHHTYIHIKASWTWIVISNREIFFPHQWSNIQVIYVIYIFLIFFILRPVFLLPLPHLHIFRNSVDSFFCFPDSCHQLPPSNHAIVRPCHTLTPAGTHPSQTSSSQLIIPIKPGSPIKQLQPTYPATNHSHRLKGILGIQGCRVKINHKHHWFQANDTAVINFFHQLVKSDT